MKKEMFINAQRDECRIAIVIDGALSELYAERASSLSSVGNVYKGRVTNVEPSIQAAFVDYGKPKNGFLHISDLHPRYFPRGQNQVEAVGRKRARRDRPPIQACLRRGEEVIVQVTKEGIGTKGATLTTYLSVPGRYLVLMPGMQRLGVSRKIEDEGLRQRVRVILEELNPPQDLGFIVRTAGLDRSKQDLQRDLNYLLRLWKAVQQRSSDARAPAELYQESDLVIRTIRDVYNTDIQRIVCDDEVVACKVREFLQLTMPRSVHRVELYTGEVSIFHAFGLEQEIDRINSARVELPSGGSLVIDQAEALVAIDVNSGRLRQSENAENTALRTNTEAALEVARQLRLRDLGGVVVIDFIDMTEDKHRRQIERLLRDEVHNDRAKTRILRMSQFGIVEMTRQRVRPSLTSSVFRPCPHCAGTGRVKSEESQALAAMRMLSLAADDDRVARIEMSVPVGVGDCLLNTRREQLTRLEQSSATRILVHGDASLAEGQYRFACTDARGSPVQWDVQAALAGQPADVPTREITDADMTRLRRARSGAEAGKPPPQPPQAQPQPPSQAQPHPAPGTPPAPAAAPPQPVHGKKPRRRRGHRGRSGHAQPQAAAHQTAMGGRPAAATQAKPAEAQAAEARTGEPGPPAQTGPPSEQPPAGTGPAQAATPPPAAPAETGAPPASAPPQPRHRPRRRPRRRRKSKAPTGAQNPQANASAAHPAKPVQQP